MMFVAVLAFIGMAAAQEAVEDPTLKTMTKMARGNFNCPVDEVDVVMDQKPEKVGDFLEPQHIRSHIGDPSTLEWAHIGQHFFSDIDGRSEEKIIATPGGDLAEFVLALSAFEEETKTVLDQATTTGLLMDYISTMSRIKFYFATSEHAFDNLTSAAGCRNLDISDPPDEKKAQLLELVTDPANVGSAHVKFMLMKPDEYQARADLVKMGIRAFHQVMWNKTFDGFDKICYIMLKGAHKEKAFVNVQTGQHCQDQGLAPLISPQTCYNSMFVNHPEAVIKFRAELAHFLAKDNKPVAQAMITKMNDKGTVQLAKSAATLLQGYPVYTVNIKLSAKK
jgi:hypothetical protein